MRKQSPCNGRQVVKMRNNFCPETIRLRLIINHKLIILSSGVASYGAVGTCSPSSLGNSVHSAAAVSLTMTKFKITTEKHFLYFRLFRQKHAKTRINGLKQSRN